MITSSTSPSPQGLLNTYRREFTLRTAAGTVRPFVFPYHCYGLALLVFYLSFSHTQRPWLYAMRWPVLATIVAFQANALSHTSSTDMGCGFGPGLVAVYIMFLGARWLVFYRPQFDSRRIMRREPGPKAQKEILRPGTNGSISSGHSISDSTMRKRRTSTKTPAIEGEGSGHTDEAEYYWQTYPENIKERLDWVLDLISNQRGERWNWGIPTLPPRPPSVRRALGEAVTGTDDEVRVSPAGHYTFSSREALLRQCLPRVAVGYITLDFIKTAMMYDPYFLVGPNDYPLPSHLANIHPFFVRASRQLLTLAAITIALESGFLLQAIFALTNQEGTRRRGFRSEVWMYPTQWGSFSIILTKGLGGLWGGWWHQTFRFLFIAPTDYLISKNIIKARTTTARLVGLLVAFVISGLFHAGGSFAQFPDTKPIEPFIFFVLQPLGIIFQIALCTALKGPISNLPSWVRTTGNFLYTFGWLCLTANWLVDDMARGGLWLFEPLPISPLRGLGLYPDKSYGWWCWQHMGISWYKGSHWWESGIALGGSSLTGMFGGFRGLLWKTGFS